MPQKYVLDDRGRSLILNFYGGPSQDIDQLAQQLNVPRWKLEEWARELGVTRPRSKLDDERRRVMFELYDGSSERINEIAARFQVDRRTVMRWAGVLNLTKEKAPAWTEEDEQYLKEHLHYVSVTDIALHLKRSRTAILMKAKRMGINKCFQEGYTMRSLATAFGCSDMQIRTWVDKGWLKGRRRQTQHVSGDWWLFMDVDVRHFICAHPMEVMSYVVRENWPWLVDVLAGGTYGVGRFDSAS
jgi:transposase